MRAWNQFSSDVPGNFIFGPVPLRVAINYVDDKAGTDLKCKVGGRIRIQKKTDEWAKSNKKGKCQVRYLYPK